MPTTIRRTGIGLDLKSAVLAGPLAGAIFMLLEMILVPLFGMGTPWGPPRMAQAANLRPQRRMRLDELGHRLLQARAALVQFLVDAGLFAAELSTVYIGLPDATTEGAWRWVAGNRLTWCAADGGRAASASSFTNWAGGYRAAASCARDEVRLARLLVLGEMHQSRSAGFASRRSQATRHRICRTARSLGSTGTWTNGPCDVPRGLHLRAAAARRRQERA
jgi:hypothetical protein